MNEDKPLDYLDYKFYIQSRDKKSLNLIDQTDCFLAIPTHIVWEIDITHAHVGLYVYIRFLLRDGIISNFPGDDKKLIDDLIMWGFISNETVNKVFRDVSLIYSLPS